MSDYCNDLLCHVVAQRDTLWEALKVVHEYQCGCESPGQLDICVAQPVVAFAVIAPEKDTT